MATHSLRAETGRQSTAGVGTVQASELRWSYQLSLGTVGGLLVLMSIWGGVMPFVGNSFGFSPDGFASFHWDFARGILAVVPAGAGLVAGLSLIQLGRVASLGLGRLGVMTAGLLAVAAGCWFAIGPAAWPVLDGHHYLVSSGAYSAFEREMAYVLGPGLLFVVLGGLACEFAALQRADSRNLAVQLVATQWVERELPVVDTHPLPGDDNESAAAPETTPDEPADGPDGLPRAEGRAEPAMGPGRS